MLISHLLLRNFGKFENFECDLTPGLNLIKGSNEAGKTTLANAITAALFLDPTEGGKELVGSIRWNSKELPALEAIFSVDGKSIRLAKDFKQGRVEIGARGGATSSRSDDVEKWLSDNLGISSEEIFKATACINQGEISHIEDSFDAIKDKLESLITGGREDQAASQTIAKIETRIRDISGEDGISGGRLEELNRLADEMNYNIDRLNKAIAGLKSKRADLIQVEMAYKNVRDDFAAKKEKLEKCKVASKLEDIFTKASHEFSEIEVKLSEAQDAIKKIKTLRDREQSIKNIDPRDIKQIDEAEANLIYLRPKRHELENERNEAKSEYDSYKVGQVFIICAIAGGLGLAVSILSILEIFLMALKPFAGYGLLTSVVLLVLGIAMTSSKNQHKGYLKERLEKLESRSTELDAELQMQTGILKASLDKYSSGSVEDLKHYLWQKDDIEKQIAREKEIYDDLLGGATVQDLESRHEALQEALEKIKRDKRELSQFVVDDVDIARQAQVLSQYEDRLKDLERERTVLRQQIGSAEGGAELLASFVERREHLRARAEKLLHDVSILRLTANCINEARQNVLVSTLEALNVRTSEILRKLTSGRYSKVRFDKSTMKFGIFSDDRNEWIDPEQGLSSGTLDQVYLAARLALADIVSEHKNPPVILDDPFANYDEKRLDNAMNVLKELSANHQILLLTSHEHYDRWADSTITL
jgi:DNA repair exonuclease SbcCD ATPase subunit